MSGTSMDGIDASLVQMNGNDIKLIKHCFLPYSTKYKQDLLRAIQNNDLALSAHLGSVWSNLAALTVKKLLKQAKLKPKKVLVVGAHGQTLLHLPKTKKLHGHDARTTVQIGDLSKLAQLTEIDVVGQFRLADMAVGGQGAPLVPYAHQLIFKKQTFCVQNMGGVGNVSCFKNNQLVLAFDTGPGNVWIDWMVKYKSKSTFNHDENGRWALKGKIHKDLVNQIIKDPFIKRRPPKSAHNPDFIHHIKRFKHLFDRLTPKDAVATVTYASALYTLKAYELFVFNHLKPDQMIVCGGGCKNGALMHFFKEIFPIKVTSSLDHGIEGQCIESISFAIFAVKLLMGQSINEPKATGARKKVLSGQIAPFRIV